ncbi:MAG TPA: ATP-binding protein, partial [Bacteroidia bacterium]|nr:ATP-binding protein [Bacteroidia bacterium]
ETLAKKNNIKKILGSAYLNIGLAMFVKNNFVLAEQYLINSLAIRKEVNDKSGEALVLSNLSDLYFKTKKYTQLEKYLKEAIAINTEIGDSLQLKDCYFKFSELYALQKNYTGAYSYRLLYEDLNDRVHNSENTRIITEMQTKYETEKKEKEIEHLDKENNKKELEITKKQNQIIIVGGISLCILAALIALYFYSNAQKQQQIVLKEKELGLLKEQKQKEIIETIITTEEKERKKIASDLHDGLGQILTAAKINLGNLNKEEVAKEKLENVAELVNAALHESKAMALNLMPLSLKENGLTESIKNICTKYNKPDVQEISFSTYNLPNTLEPIVEINVYRICQELINNAVKYSKATKVFLQLFCRDNKLIIQIEDNGIGFDKNNLKQESLGMNILKERVTLLNGEMEIDSVLTKGTNIFIELSL